MIEFTIRILREYIRNHTWSCWCWVLWPLGLWAQEGALPTQQDTRFLHFSISDGLPSNGIRSLSVDGEGFVWIGSLNGLARWDGQRIKAFSALAPQVELPEDDVKLLFADSHGNLWVKFLRHPGLYRVELATYRVEHFDAPFYEHGERFPPNAFEDAAGNVWFATQMGLSCFRWPARRLEYYPLAIEGHTNITIQACRTPDGRIWVGSTLGLFEFNPQQGTYRPVRLFDNDRRIHIVAADAEGHLWIGRWYDEHGVLEYDPAQGKIVREFRKQGNGPGVFFSTEVSRIYADGDWIWFCCNEGGLCVWDKKTAQLQRFDPDETDPGTLSTHSAMCAVRDPYDNFWVGTEGALDLMVGAEKMPQLLAHNPHYTESLVYSKANTALALSDGRLVFGTDRGVSIYDPARGTWRNAHLPLYKGTTYNDVVVSLAAHDATSFWAGTWEGLYRLDSRTGAVLQAYPSETSFDGRQINVPHQMLRDSRGVLWWCYNNAGPRRWQADHFDFLDTLSNDGNPLNDRAYCFAEQQGRCLFIGTADGVVRYDFQRQVFQNLPVSFPATKPPIKVTGLCAGQNGLLYAIANDQVFSFDPDVERPVATAVPFSFPLKNCLDLLEDRRGDLWVCTEGGLARFDPKRSAGFFFDARNFLKGNTFYSIWHFKPSAKAPDGRLYFAGISGISVLNPDALAAQSKPPVAKVTGLSINNQTAVLPEALHRLGEVSLAHWENNLSLELSAPGSPLPPLNHYAYRLVREGFQTGSEPNNWVELGTQHTVHFSNLSPGSYRLEVRAANSDGVWCAAPALLRIRVRFPWYATWAAWCCYALVLGAGAVAFYRYHLQRRLKHAETERLKELDRFKTRFFTNITHEFRTPLTVVLGMAERVLGERAARENPATVAQPLTLIKRNGENLLRLINEILDLAKLENSTLSFHYVQGDVLGYLRYLAESLHSVANAQNVLLRVESEEAALIMDYDPERLAQIAHNLLSNAIKFTPNGGRVVLRVERGDKTEGGNWKPGGATTLRLTVVDTGVGIPAADLPFLFDRFFQAQNQSANKVGGSGIGLSLTRELVRGMGGDITVQSPAPGSDRGTAVAVFLPIHREAPLETARVVVPNLGIGSVSPLPTAPTDKTVLEETSAFPTLLIIEDNPDVVEYLSGCLQGLYHLDYAYNGRAGVEKALETVPDLIISDVMMPEKDGLEVCDLLKNDPRTSHVPLVLLTAKADMGSRLAGLRRGADAYLAKPFHPQELLATLHNLTGMGAKLRARYAAATMPEPSTDPGTQMEDAFVQQVRTLVETHLSDAAFGMPQLERALAMSRSQIFRKLKALTGLSPTLFIRSVRLQKAKELLADPSLSISEIAYDTGFSSPQYFSDAFLEEFGQRPSELRGKGQ